MREYPIVYTFPVADTGRRTATIPGRFILLLLLASVPFIGAAVFSTLWTARASGELIRNQLQNYTSTLHAVIDTLLKANVQTYLRSKVEVGVDALRAVLREHPGDGAARKTGLEQAVGELLNYKVGVSGYYYALDLEGNVVFHPDAAIVGTSQAGKEPIDTQVVRRTGYFEYMWQNTYEEAPRRKALYMEFIPELGWILTATSYRDEFTRMIDLEGLRSAVNSVVFGQSGYSYIVDREGLVISHPYLQGEYVRDHFSPEEGELLMSRFFSAGSGYTTYPWKDPGSRRTRVKMVNHKQLEDFGWVVATSMYVDEMNRPLLVLAGTNAAIALAAALALAAAVYFITRSIDRPMLQLIEVLRRSSAGDLSVRAEPAGLRELDEVADHLNYFIQALHDKIAALGNLTAGIAHELNSPLGAIRSTARSMEANMRRCLEDQQVILAGLSPGERVEYYALLDRARLDPAKPDRLLDRELRRRLETYLSNRGLPGREDLVDALISLGAGDDPEALGTWLSSDRGIERLAAASRVMENFYSVRLIDQASRTAAKVVDTLRNYIYTGEEGAVERLSASQEVELVLTQFQGRIREGLEVRRDYDPQAVLEGDRKRLSVVWNALIKNALDSMGNSGVLGVRTSADGGRTRVEISDTGPGVDPAIRDRIFEPFVTTKTGGAGMGLGLDIARKIVQEYGGTIEFESVPGRTTFRVTFPKPGAP